MPSFARYLLVRLLALGLVAALALAAREVVAVPRYVPSGSMLPTLWPGDQLLVSRLRYRDPRALPRRGDVVVVRGVGGDRIKRVIGLPGDRVGLRGGIPVLNGRALVRYRVADMVLPASPNLQCPVLQRVGSCRLRRYRETLPNGRSWNVLDLGATPSDDRPTVTIPPARLFLLGDNRDNSTDSRIPVPQGIGLVSVDALIGRATIILWSSDGRGSWARPWAWGKTLRRKRIMRGVERTPRPA